MPVLPIMNEATESYHRAAALVDAWGGLRLSDGRTLKESLSVGGISLWDVVSPSFVMNHVSRAIGQKTGKPLMSSGDLLARRCKKNISSFILPLKTSTEGCRRWPSKEAFLFLGFSRYMYRETLSSVAYDMLLRRDAPLVVLTDSDEAIPGSGEIRTPTVSTVWSHWNRQTWSSLQDARLELRRAGGAIMAEGLFNKEENAQDTNLTRALGNTFKWLLEVYIPNMLPHLAVANHIFSAHRPKLIVSPDVNDPRTRIFNLLAKKYSVPSLEVQLGFYTVNDVEWRFFVADKLATTGHANSEVMRSHGVPPERMIVTGSPRYDYPVRPFLEGEALKQTLGIGEGLRSALFASQPYCYGVFPSKQARRARIKALFDAAAKIQGFVLVVKPHPLEAVEELKMLADNNPNIVFAEKTADIRGIIRVCEVFTTFFSNATFDALVLRKPVVLLSFPELPACELFEKSGAVLAARTDEEVFPVLQSVVAGSILLGNIDAARSRFLEDWLYKLDGRATERISDLAIKLAEAGIASPGISK